MRDNIQTINIYAEKIDNLLVIRLQGSLNALTVEKFIYEIKKHNAKNPVILDMEELSLVSSTGIKALKELCDFSYNTQKKIVLLNLSNHVRMVLNMLNLGKLFPVAPNEELAVKLALKTKDSNT